MRKTYAILGILIIFGFFFRYQGISQQLSYWNDESHTALRIRNILQPSPEILLNTGLYQIAFYYLTAIAFYLLGINEFAGRLPSVLAGTSLIVSIFFITRKFFECNRRAYLAAFLVAFSQIQLAWSTQLRPYIWLELMTLLVAYFSYQSLRNSRKFFDSNLIYSLITAIISGLFHGTGLINVALVGLVIFYKILLSRRYKYLLALIILITIVGVMAYFSMHNFLSLLFKFDFDVLHYRIFLTHHYGWLLAGAGLGAVFLWRKDKKLSLILVSFIGLILFISIFKISSQYVRYSLPAFPLLYLLFSSGVIDLSDWINLRVSSFKFQVSSYLRKTIAWGVVALFLIWPLKENKILLFTKYYYSINADMRENPIVDYKLAFTKIKELIKGKQNVIVMDAWNDRVPWYLPGQKFVFLKSESKYIDTFVGEKTIGTIEDFEKEKKLYKHGVVIVEDWPSQTPEELKGHIRATLKHQFDVQDLPYNENDHWGISVYSWGL